jgi:hypothetical protein
MGPLVAGLIMRVLDLPQPALPIRLMKEMVIQTILLDRVFVM